MIKQIEFMYNNIEIKIKLFFNYIYEFSYGDKKYYPLEGYTTVEEAKTHAKLHVDELLSKYRRDELETNV